MKLITEDEKQILRQESTQHMIDFAETLYHNYLKKDPRVTHCRLYLVDLEYLSMTILGRFYRSRGIFTDLSIFKKLLKTITDETFTLEQIETIVNRALFRYNVSTTFHHSTEEQVECSFNSWFNLRFPNFL